jgi:hypothetical protein
VPDNAAVAGNPARELEQRQGATRVQRPRGHSR